MNIHKYLNKAGYTLDVDLSNDEFVIKDKSDKEIKISIKETEQYLFIKLLELIEHEYKSNNLRL